jgi:hypothetical protein
MLYILVSDHNSITFCTNHFVIFENDATEFVVELNFNALVLVECFCKIIFV